MTEHTAEKAQPCTPSCVTRCTDCWVDPRAEGEHLPEPCAAGGHGPVWCAECMERWPCRSARLNAVEAVARRWADVLAECKQADPRWLLDQGVMALDVALRELRTALSTPPGKDSS